MKKAAVRRRKKTALNTLTPFPWRRDRKGGLCGASGRPIFFQGTDAMVIEHAPVMLKRLVTIRAQARPTAAGKTGDRLYSIWRLAEDLIAELDRAATEPRFRIAGTIP